MIYLTSDNGRIGPFWWINAVTYPTELQNATYNGSTHNVWREGASGWDGIYFNGLKWWIVK